MRVETRMAPIPGAGLTGWPRRGITSGADLETRGHRWLPPWGSPDEAQSILPSGDSPQGAPAPDPKSEHPSGFPLQKGQETGFVPKGTESVMVPQVGGRVPGRNGEETLQDLEGFIHLTEASQNHG